MKAKNTLTDLELEQLRDCDDMRARAIINLLASSGIRARELIALNRGDVNFEERECVVGDSGKKRIAYFDARAKIHLQGYLHTRTDDNAALFVSREEPYERLQLYELEVLLREQGYISGVPGVQASMFRHTFATEALSRGMPAEQLQKLLGLKKISTTLGYATMRHDDVKRAHRKFMTS